MTRPDLIDPGAVAAQAAADPALQVFDRAVRAALRPLLTDALIEEHRRTPAGPHGRGLTAVLSYLRRSSITGKLAILALEPLGPYRIVALSGVRGVPPCWASDTVFATLDEADHGVFLMRVASVWREHADD